MYPRCTLALVLSLGASVGGQLGCGSSSTRAEAPSIATAPTSAAAVERVPMVLVDTDDPAGLPLVSTIRAEDAYELCTLGGDPVARRDCYLATVDSVGPACGSLQHSVDGHIVARCTPPADCRSVTKRFRSVFGRRPWLNPTYQPALSSGRTTKLTLVMPDWRSMPGAPRWVDLSMDYDDAPTDAQSLAIEFADLCR